MNKKELVKDLKPYSTLMNEEQYWAIIEASLENSKDQSEQSEYITKVLEKLTLEDIIGFDLTTSYLTNEIYSSHMWCAGFIMNKGYFDDAFGDFRDWVVSRGKAVYYSAKDNPDTLISEVDFGEGDYYSFECFESVAWDVFEKETGEEIFEYKDSLIEYNDDITFDWEEDDDESMQVICPQLYAYFEE
ncbi:DUF4240 domain-containing protein [Myroides marinus]|uniref:DUF4240 domain-containing protein n=1 Tax=Myroides marinus TaxID=703342 RepID=UPI0025785D6E|nr:DUF4240 domain-containing protein [Myroides marinus]MDM1360599.1 DUF4240 domain-containing protein [Myroides marinus]